MKKQIVSAIVLAGMIATSSAFASDARELVMGFGGAQFYSQGGGTFFYDNAYNFFYNPAYVNDFKNFAIFEKGTSNVSGTDANGGFVTSMMNFNFGLFVNRNAALTDWSGSGLTGTIGTNALDVMFGGDAGVKWGLGLTYAGDSTSAFKKQTDLDLRAGVSVAGFDPFASFKIIGEDKVTGVKTNKYTNFGGGLRYHYGEWVPYGFYRTAKGKVEAAGTDTKRDTWAVGLGRETKIAEGARLVYSLYWAQAQQKTTPATSTLHAQQLPIDMAVESDVLSWLTLRGGLAHTFIGSDTIGIMPKRTLARVGGTFHIAKVDVDYAFGNGNGAATGAGTDVIADSQDVGFDSGTFHKVSLRYSW